jgi:hypothetical protein
VKHKVCEIEGALLDCAVALALSKDDHIAGAKYGKPFVHAERCIVGFCDGPQMFARMVERLPDLVGGSSFLPSRAWSDGGPLIEREKIKLRFECDEWEGVINGENGARFCASVFGDEVELLP